MRKILILVPLLLSASPAFAQDAPIKRIPLQKYDVPGANYETIMGIAEIKPNVMMRTTGIRIAVSTRAAPRSPLARLALPIRNIGSLVRRQAFPTP